MSEPIICDTIAATLNFPISRQDRIFWIALMAVALFGAAVLLISTPWGIGLTPDSVIYIGQTQDLLKGRGYSQVTYMPGFPVAVAVLGKLGPKPLAAARFTQAMLLTGNLFLAGALVQIATGSIVAAFIASLMLLCSPDILLIHSYAWSEPLFIFLILITACALLFHLRAPSLWKLLVAGIALGLSYLTRYAGVAFIGVTILALLLFQQTNWRRRIFHVVILCTIVGVAMAAWMIRSRLLGRAAAGRPMVWHPISSRHLNDGWHRLIQWVMPLGARTALAWVCAMIIAGTTFFVWNKWFSEQENSRKESKLPAIMGLFVIVYSCFLVVSISLFDFGTPMDARILSPALVCAIVGGCAYFSQVPSKSLRAGALAVAVGLLVLWGDASAKQLANARRTGLGYASKQWKKSPTLTAVHKLPRQTQIYTNMWDVITILEDRPARTVPNHKIVVQARDNPNFESEMRTVVREVQAGQTVIVLFNNQGSRASLASDKDFAQRMTLRVIKKTKDGVIYDAGSPASTQK